MESTDVQPTKQYFNLGEGTNGNGGAFGSGNDLFTILLLFFLFGSGSFGGGFGNRNGNAAADMAVTNTEAIAESRAGLNFLGQNAAAQGVKLDSILLGQSNNTATIQSTLSNGFNTLGLGFQSGLSALNTSIQDTKYDTTRAIENCCCTTQQSIAALSANLDRSTCAIITSSKDNTQAILSALCTHWQEEAQLKIGDLQRQLSEANIISALKNA